VCRVSGTAVRHYTYDANGNVGQLVDEAGAIVAHYEYDPFGNEIRAEGDDAQANPFRFSTKYLDAETGLYYYGFRYYSTETGRWISRDPLGEKGGINLYTFVVNNGINKFDLFGLTKPHWLINGTRAHNKFFEWLHRNRPLEFITDTPISSIFKDIPSKLEPDVLHIYNKWVWDLKHFHPMGATPDEVKQLDLYIAVLKTKCFKKGPPRFVIPIPHTYVGDINDAANPRKKLHVYVSPGYEDGILTYTLEEDEDFDDDFWKILKEVKPQDLMWLLLLPIISLTPSAS